MSFQLKLNSDERSTFRLHLAYMLIEGFVLGVLALNEFVFLKSIKGSNYQLGLLFQFSMIVFLFLILINEFLKRIKNRRKLLRIAGILSRLPLLVIFFFPNNEQAYQNSTFHIVFLGLFLIYFAGNIFINPNINYLLKSNYTHSNFGKLYSYATSSNKIVMLVVTFIYGFVLDIDNYIFTFIIPIMGIMAIVSVFVLSLIPQPEEGRLANSAGIFSSVSSSIKEMRDILVSNVPYRHFEIGFLMYGFSFMISVTVITIYFYDGLNLNYSSVAFYRNAYNILAIVLLPYFGRLLGNIDPRRFAALTFSTIALYIFFVMITDYLPYHFELYGVTIYYTLILYVVFHGLFASTMVLLWNIGSAYFCRPEQAGTYQSLHLSLTGFRAIFSPLLGVLFYELFGFTVTFAIAIFCLLSAMLLMRWSYKRENKQECLQ
ncbi:MAG: MFS transporter [Chlorobi bacterium]|nr:MFS transporter [Chlorobiota bacterium]